MSYKRKAAVGAAKSHCELRDLPDFREEEARARGHIRQAPSERQWIAAVASEIESNRYISIARQCDRDGLHQLLRTGEAMRNHHHWACFGRLRPKDGDRNLNPTWEALTLNPSISSREREKTP